MTSESRPMRHDEPDAGGREPGDGARRIADNRTTFAMLVDAAGKLARAGEHNAALMAAEIAAHWAWTHHPGMFTSVALERIVCDIGRRLPPPASAAEDRDAVTESPQPEHVLHVLTAAHPAGGHTRLVWRWFENDAARRHSVVTTDQHEAGVPAALALAARTSGGVLRSLKTSPGGLLGRAAALRDMAAGKTLVVLHAHPYDALPLAAFSGLTGRPRIILLNHADHVFWLGAGVADFVASLREPGRALAWQRRGIAKQRCGLLPIAIDTPARIRSKHQAKREIGVAPDEILCLTVAAAYKYRTAEEIDFVSALLPLFAQTPSLRVIAIGPENEGMWRRGERESGGRISALGSRSDLAPYYEAADIYIDSFPFFSTTSRLEAGRYGVPLIGYSPHPPGAEVLRSDEPHPVMIRAFELHRFREEIARLIVDREHRERLGAHTASLIENTYCGAAWAERLEALYAEVRRKDFVPANGAGPTQMRSDPVDLALACMQQRQQLKNMSFIA